MRRASSYSSYMAASVVAVVVATGSLTQALSQPASPALDYEYFKTKVQPVFLTKRDGHSRCIACHTQNNAPFHLVKLSPGAKEWTEQQSQQNFTLIKRVAIPGSMDSPIVKHPLAEQAGGDPHHGGGQQFESQNDPAWQALKGFVMGQKT